MPPGFWNSFGILGSGFAPLITKTSPLQSKTATKERNRINGNQLCSTKIPLKRYEASLRQNKRQDAARKQQTTRLQTELGQLGHQRKRYRTNRNQVGTKTGPLNYRNESLNHKNGSTSDQNSSERMEPYQRKPIVRHKNPIAAL